MPMPGTLGATLVLARVERRRATTTVAPAASGETSLNCRNGGLSRTVGVLPRISKKANTAIITAITTARPKPTRRQNTKMTTTKHSTNNGT